MHWTEVVAIIIVVAALIPLFILVAYLIAFSWAGVSGWAKSRRIGVGREYHCDQGVFIREYDSWFGKTEFDGRNLALVVRDEGGLPDSIFLRRLPQILAGLAGLERTARDRVPKVTGEYELDSILSPEHSADDYEFALGFVPTEENFEVSIYVNFQGDQVINWVACD